ncbi:hypothetical protein N8D74_17730 (plasmid) [Curtobacterium flaccumfaciens]|uniref:Antitoxin VbhA domain-containing protein n=1 Tax=Curtobacterium poinsettiae TaxID=159612 RepID=A0A9Q9T5D2_9MICO|nr:antitoxin VbhA family protein [Curtobacterium flaccumfaciens]MBT1620566.1 antitoxin VbhA family protein [Curtobacterium flaccumfaciens pv. poinsettiae]MCS6563597.1 hypothetical protein [Curtobacterium flaccumfaciens pv. poinsettiae]MCU0154534.1 hypothetical protein [Curtobacterium flaccumfaciens pv. poinsettiae]UXN16929.1 hypothetical protein N8D76_17240 [Curtobacterium flaccumfaciens pv. poinsettiae]UXN27221.1 hypothetical protein N8D74_17730 [Curtobacterium flaccumfaciens]
MSISTTHRTTGKADVDERRRRVEIAVHSGEMEGLTVTPESRADAEDYVAGSISSSELVRRVRARYGLR